MNHSLCHVITTLDPGGAENALVDLVTGLKNKGFDQDIVYLKGEGQLIPTFDALAISVKKIAMESFLEIPKAQSLLASHIRHKDIVHSHLLKANSLAAMAKSEQVLVGTRHNDESIINNPLVKFMHQKFSGKEDAHIAISQAVNDFYVNHGLDIAKFNTIVYGYKVPTLPDKIDLKKQFNIPDHHHVLLHAGRLVEQKGQKDLLDALAQLEDVSLLLCGEGPLKPQLEEQVITCQLEHRVHFCGFRDDLHQLMVSSDLFVLPSHWEGLGRVLLESMAMGLPVVASRVSAIPEVMGDCGYLCEAQNSTSLKETIEAALNDQNNWSRQKEQMQSRLESHFSFDKMIEEHRHLYQRLLNG